MTDDVKTLIHAATGYTVTDDDNSLLDLLYNQTEQSIKNYCNISEITQELEPELNERVAALFIKVKKAAVLGDESVCVATSIKEGDTEVQLSGTTPEERLDSLIAEWTKERDLVCFRRLRW